MKPLYPMFLKLDGRPVLVVGGGRVASMKVPRLLDCGAAVTVVSPEICERLLDLVSEKRIDHIARPFRDSDVNGAGLVLCATDIRTVNEEVANACRERNVLVNVADVPDLCDFYMASVVRRGRLQMAFSTTGAAPALSRRLRQRFENEYGDIWTSYLDLLARFRDELKKRWPDSPKRRMSVADALLDTPALKILEDDGSQAAWEYMMTFLNERQETTS